LFKALLLAVWYDPSDVKLAEASDDRASFRWFCGFSADEATPERTAFVRFRRHLIARGLDKTLFDAVTGQLRAKAITVKTGALVDATVIASASHKDGEAAWSKHRRRGAVFGFKAHVGADAETALVEEVAVTPGNVNDGRADLKRSRTIPAMSMPIARIAARSSDPLWWRAVDGPRSYRQAPGVVRATTRCDE
jgi:IS5 family transposase